MRETAEPGFEPGAAEREWQKLQRAKALKICTFNGRPTRAVDEQSPELEAIGNEL